MSEILFISRGLGWGHSIRDILIAEEIFRNRPEISLGFSSYDSGYRAYEAFGRCCFNLDLPAAGSVGRRICRLAKYIREVAPMLIVSDEELFALPLSRGLGIPCILITNWFPPPGDEEGIDMFNQADMILLAEQSGFPRANRRITSPILYTGPIYRRNAYTAQDLQAARESLGIGVEERIILVTLGGSGSITTMAANISLLEIIIEAFLQSQAAESLCLVCGSLGKFFSYASSVDECIRIIDNTPDILKLAAISHLVITRGGINTLWEMADIGVPTLAIPYPPSINMFEELYVQIMAKRGLTIYISQQDLTVEKLLTVMQEIQGPDYRNRVRSNFANLHIEWGVPRAAQAIMAHFDTHCWAKGR
ncbi:MAG: hypothetical protein HPY52_07745 [Firmicutes bacterium]|nr:hypothetical protein [Bacillota bacterium]